MSLSDYIILGNSKLRVSPLCLGTTAFGEGRGENVEESQRILRRYIQAGGNFVDTANVYADGCAEQIIGDFLRLDGIKREEVVIASKFFGSDYASDPANGGASRKSIIASCEQSLKRLQSDYLDVYWLHRWDKYTPIQETMSVLNDLVSQGKVRYIGFSDAPAWKIVEAQMIAEFRCWSPLIALQNEYSLLERSVEVDLVPMALELGMALIPWAPLKMGILSGKFTRENRGLPGREPQPWQAAALTDKAYQYVDALNAIAREIGASAGQCALAWVRQQPCVSSSIIMGADVQEISHHIDSLNVELDDQHLRLLQNVADKQLLEHSVTLGAFVDVAPSVMAEPDVTSSVIFAPTNSVNASNSAAIG